MLKMIGTRRTSRSIRGAECSTWDRAPRLNRVIGSAGLTSYRMDPFAEAILPAGVKGFIGKGRRSPVARAVMRDFGAVYFSSFGGAGAYLSKRILSSRVIAFGDLGPEAVLRLEVADFPAIVVNDIHGGDLYEDALPERG